MGGWSDLIPLRELTPRGGGSCKMGRGQMCLSRVFGYLMQIAGLAQTLVVCLQQIVVVYQVTSNCLDWFET